jgi:hypothetical protein
MKKPKEQSAQTEPKAVAPRAIPMVSVVNVDADGNETKVVTGAGTMRGRPNRAATLAALEACQAGMSLEEVIHAAKLAYGAEQQGEQPPEAIPEAPEALPEAQQPTSDSEQPSVEVSTQDKRDAITRAYLLSVLDYDRGAFLGLTGTELLAAALHVQKPVMPMDEWVRRMGFGEQ